MTTTDTKQPPVTIQHILDSLLKAMELGEEDEKVVRQTIINTLVAELSVKISKSVPESDMEEFSQRAKEVGSNQEKLGELLQEMVDKYPEIEKAIKNYMENDYPDHVKELVFTYLDKATPEQRKKFFKLAETPPTK